MVTRAAAMADMAQVRRVLQEDPVWAAYAIADLQPVLAPYCQWSVTAAGEEPGLLLLFTGLEPPILLTVGEADAVAALLTEAALPEKVFISARQAHVPPIEEYYQFDRPEQGTTFEQMLRMVFRHQAVLTDVTVTHVQRLAPADVPRIEQLLTHGGPFTPDAFEAYQLDEGVFFGVCGAGGELVAVGGTHIVDWSAGVAAVGNMYTHPAERGQGYARLILGAIVKTLQQGGVDNIVLNVNTKNSTARRIYEQYGFVVHCEFAEGMGIKRQQATINFEKLPE